MVAALSGYQASGRRCAPGGCDQQSTSVLSVAKTDRVRLEGPHSRGKQLTLRHQSSTHANRGFHGAASASRLIVFNILRLITKPTGSIRYGPDPSFARIPLPTA